MTKAYRVTITPWRLRHLWRPRLRANDIGARLERQHGRKTGLAWRLGYRRWGSAGGVNHTECVHRRFGPFVVHAYSVKTGN